jgi:hypothetical protein
MKSSQDFVAAMTAGRSVIRRLADHGFTQPGARIPSPVCGNDQHHRRQKRGEQTKKPTHENAPLRQGSHYCSIRRQLRDIKAFSDIA